MSKRYYNRISIFRLCSLLTQRPFRTNARPIHKRANLHKVFSSLSKRSECVGSIAMQPLWLRCFAAFCLLLLSVASTAQAAHVHSRWADHTKAIAHSSTLDSQSENGEEHCQLCQAMHSAQPVTSTLVPLTAQRVVQLLAAELTIRSANSQWLFAMFSRPPPVSAIA